MAGSFPIIRDTIITNNRAGYFGGGIYAAPPNLLTLIHVNVISNSAAHGGGAFVGGTLTPPARAILTGGHIENNYCTAVNCIGGGLLADLPTITDTLFIGNSAAGGGGGLVAYTTTLVGGRFENNWTTGFYGGGIELWGGLTLSGTEFISNSAALGGGGIAVDGGDSFIVDKLARNRCVSPGCLGGGAFIARGLNLANTQFISNSAAGNGGGLAHHPFSGDPAGRVINTLFASNSAFYDGADLYLNSPGNVVILHSTIATPTLGGGAAIYVNAGTVGITNTIITSHSIGIQRGGGIVYENYNLFFGNGVNTIDTVGGGNSIIGALAFLDPATDDYQLTDTSAAIDAGVDAAVTSDFEGNGRPQINGFDIGYDEL